MPPDSMLLASVTSLDQTSNCHLRKPSTPQWTRPVWIPTRMLTFTPVTSRTKLYSKKVNKCSNQFAITLRKWNWHVSPKHNFRPIAVESTIVRAKYTSGYNDNSETLSMMMMTNHKLYLDIILEWNISNTLAIFCFVLFRFDPESLSQIVVFFWNKNLDFWLDPNALFNCDKFNHHTFEKYGKHFLLCLLLNGYGVLYIFTHTHNYLYMHVYSYLQ